MKTTFFIFAAILLLTLNACTTDNRQDTENDNSEANTKQDTPVKLIEYLIGEWEIDRSTRGAENRTAAGSPGERITFTTEARFVAYEGNEKVDSGAYRMNEQLTNLYLESEANKTPREFDMELKTDTMTLKPEGNAQQGSGSYVYLRVGSASVPPDKSDDAQ